MKMLPYLADVLIITAGVLLLQKELLPHPSSLGALQSLRVPLSAPRVLSSQKRHRGVRAKGRPRPEQERRQSPHIVFFGPICPG